MAKQLTLTDMFKKELERQCTLSGIDFKRKQGGLRLDVFGNPEVYPSDEAIRLQLIGGTSGRNGSRDYVSLVFNVGEAANPATDPEAIIHKVMEAVRFFRKMEGLADKKE